jgi:hypothetical protein
MIRLIKRLATARSERRRFAREFQCFVYKDEDTGAVIISTIGRNKSIRLSTSEMVDAFIETVKTARSQSTSKP